MSISWQSHPVSPAQNIEGSPPVGGLLFEVGTGPKLYYVTNAEVGVAEATYTIWIMESLDGGLTWAKVYDNPASAINPDVFSVILAGDILYIFSDGGNQAFDTTTNSMATIASGPLVGFNRFAILSSLLSNNTVLVSYCDHTTHNLKCVVYNVGSNSWNAPIAIAASGANGSIPVGQAVDPATNSVYLFASNPAGQFDVYCYKISSGVVSAPVLAFTRTSGFSLVFNYNSCFGLAAVANGEVAMPFVDPDMFDFSSANPTQYVARSPLNLSGFTVDTVDGPGPPYISNLHDTFLAMALLNVNGVLYLFYVTNVNTADNAASIESVKFSLSSAPGTWSAPATAYTAVQPSAGCSINPVLRANGEIGILHGYANPVTFATPGSKYAALRNVYLGGSGAPRVKSAREIITFGFGSGTVTGNSTATYNPLPDPKVCRTRKDPEWQKCFKLC